MNKQDKESPQILKYRKKFVINKELGLNIKRHKLIKNSFLPNIKSFKRYDLDSGNYYIGECKNLVKEGFGVFVYIQDREKYLGFWKNDMRNGFGEYIYQDGTVFKGEFFEDKKHGKGVIISNEFVIEGNWIKGLKEGRFVKFNLKTQQIETFIFQEGKRIKKYNFKTRQNLKNDAFNFVTKKIKKMKNKKEFVSMLTIPEVLND